MKIGLIQNEAAVGDLSQNLRRIVQGYRQCLDEGAELVIASAAALDGPFLRDLATRSSFRLQARAALNALASEIRLPLLLVSHAGEPQDTPAGRPWLINHDETRPLRNQAVVQIGGHRFFIDAGDTPTPCEAGTGWDYILHLPNKRWWIGQDEEWQQLIQTEASACGAAVVLLRGVGCSEGKLMPGGSMVATPAGPAVKLPQFAPAARVWHKRMRTAKAGNAPAPTEQQLRAICYGISQTLQQSGFSALAVDEGAEHAGLLLALARLSVGARRTTLLAGKNKTAYRALAGRSLDIEPTQAEDNNLLLLNGKNIRQRLLWKHGTLGAACSRLAPLGEMYDSEIHRLQNYVLPKLPQALQGLLTPESNEASDSEEAVLRQFVEENASLAEILAHTPTADETQLRRILRQLEAGLPYRNLLSPCIRLRRRLTHLPPYHKHYE